MKNGILGTATIKLERIFLDLKNPRHEPFETEKEVIAFLCGKEKIFELAKDIAKHGINPFELLALVNDGDNNYTVLEGNRRVCALKLLTDPELAPIKLRAKFKTLAEEWLAIEKLSCYVCETRTEADLWLIRIHNGLQGGIGRKEWEREQKTRFDGNSTNTLPQTLLDLAETKGFITKEERKGQLSIMESYAKNEVFKASLGIEKSEPDKISTTLSNNDFDLVFKKFMRDIAIKKITTRKGRTKKEIENYAKKIRNIEGFSGERVKLHAVSKNKKKPQSNKIVGVDEISRQLSQIENEKLISLYYSLHTLTTIKHTPLLTVGAWTFFNILTGIHGRKSDQDLVRYLDKDRLNRMGLHSSEKILCEALERFLNYGDTTKHDPTAGAFSSGMLIDDFAAVRELILRLIKEILLESRT